VPGVGCGRPSPVAAGSSDGATGRSVGAPGAQSHPRAPGRRLDEGAFTGAAPAVGEDRGALAHRGHLSERADVMAKRVAIAGGGLAGLSCAKSLIDAGLDVSLFEGLPYLGGRASTYRDADGDWIEQGLHVFLGTYSEFKTLLDEIGRPARRDPVLDGRDPLPGPRGARGRLRDQPPAGPREDPAGLPRPESLPGVRSTSSLSCRSRPMPCAAWRRSAATSTTRPSPVGGPRPAARPTSWSGSCGPSVAPSSSPTSSSSPPSTSWAGSTMSSTTCATPWPGAIAGRARRPSSIRWRGTSPGTGPRSGPA
jgi:hypothetical protein